MAVANFDWQMLITMLVGSDLADGIQVFDGIHLLDGIHVFDGI